VAREPGGAGLRHKLPWRDGLDCQSCAWFHAVCDRAREIWPTFAAMLDVSLGRETAAGRLELD